MRFLAFLAVLLLLVAPIHAEDDRLPGVALAEGISQITGVAISPLLGVSVMGAYQYWRAPEAVRDRLPWYTHPFAWGAGFAVLGLCFLKDLFGAAAPPLMKKPLDVLELFEDKLSGLVACSGFVPFIAAQFTDTAVRTDAALGLAGLHYASALDWIAVPLAMIWFLVVWLACHTINVLITLSPWGLVDAGLKLLKTALLSVVVVSSYISPFLGLIVSVLVLGGALLVAPWAFRLMVFGTAFGLDLMMPSRASRRVRLETPHAFWARSYAGVPSRTYGRLARSEAGHALFLYRPWLILPERSVSIPPVNAAVAEGMFFPSLLQRTEDGHRAEIFLMFLPRYRTHEQTIARHFAISEVQPSPVLRGWRAIRAWLGEMLSARRLRPPEPGSPA